MNETEVGQKATVEMPPDRLPALVGPESGIVTAVVGVITAILWLRRKLSRDNTEVAKDAAEAKYVIGLTQELEKARAALVTVYTERNKLSEEVGELRASVKFLKEANQKLEERIAQLEHQVKGE